MTTFASPFATQLRALADAFEAEAEARYLLIQKAFLGTDQPLAAAAKGAKTPRVAKAMDAEPRAKGAKRSQEELEALVDKLHTYISKNPGQRIEQIGSGMDVDTKELKLPVQKLREAKMISVKGQKRAAAYTARG